MAAFVDRLKFRIWVDETSRSDKRTEGRENKTESGALRHPPSKMPEYI
jgi:hypothetical protein